MFNRNNGNNNNESQQFEMLDALTIVGFCAQLDNMMKDEKQTEFIHGIIQAIGDEIEKLHKENNIIIEQNNQIIKLLKGEENV